jgi:hypothetical protein
MSYAIVVLICHDIGDLGLSFSKWWRDIIGGMDENKKFVHLNFVY